MTQYKAYERWLIITAASALELSDILFSHCAAGSDMAFEVVAHYAKQDEEWTNETFIKAATNLINQTNKP